MSDNSRTIRGTVKIESESGDPARVAKELAWAIATKEKMPEGTTYRKWLLDIYAECHEAARGHRTR